MVEKVTIDIEPKWEDLCRASSRGALDPIELMQACVIADLVRQAQKKGSKSITFTFIQDEVQVETKEWSENE